MFVSGLFCVVKDSVLLITIIYHILWMLSPKTCMLFKSCPTSTNRCTPTDIVLWFTMESYMISIIQLQLRCLWVKKILIHVVSDPNGSSITLVGLGPFYQPIKWNPDWHHIMKINRNLYDINHIQLRCLWLKKILIHVVSMLCRIQMEVSSH